MDADDLPQAMQERRTDTNTEPVFNEDVDFSDPDILYERPYRNRRSPIIVEFADAREVSIIEMATMMEAGMNIMKMRMSFNTYNDRIRLVQKAERAVQLCSEKFRISKFPVAICGSLLTSMIKSGIIEGTENQILLEEGASIDLTNDMHFYDKCSAKLIYVDNNDFVNLFKEGWEISIADGSIILVATEKINTKRIRCVVTKSGKLRNLQTVSFRYKGEYSQRDFLTKRDINGLEFVKDYKLDMLIIYYPRSAKTIQRIKQHLPRSSGRPQIFGAICTQEGLDAIDELLRECDGLVLAREFLTWEMSKECVFRLSKIQKWVAAKCQKVGKPLFLSGGVLSEVVKSGELNYHETSDVTNALFDGVTGFILKEVLDLKHALKAVKSLNKICCTVEPLIFNKAEFCRLASEIKVPVNNAEAAMISAAMVAKQVNARVIILPTVSGRTAKALLWLRPSAIIITVSTKPRSTRYLFIHRNIIPLMYAGHTYKKWAKTVHNRIVYALEFAIMRGFLEHGDMYVTLQRSYDDISYCDMVRIFSVTTAFGKHKLEDCEFAIKCFTTGTVLLKDNLIVTPDTGLWDRAICYEYKGFAHMTDEDFMDCLPQEI